MQIKFDTKTNHVTIDGAEAGMKFKAEVVTSLGEASKTLTIESQDGRHVQAKARLSPAPGVEIDPTRIPSLSFSPESRPTMFTLRQENINASTPQSPYDGVKISEDFVRSTFGPVINLAGQSNAGRAVHNLRTGHDSLCRARGVPSHKDLGPSEAAFKQLQAEHNDLKGKLAIAEKTAAEEINNLQRYIKTQREEIESRIKTREQRIAQLEAELKHATTSAGTERMVRRVLYVPRDGTIPPGGQGQGYVYPIPESCVEHFDRIVAQSNKYEDMLQVAQMGSKS